MLRVQELAAVLIAAPACAQDALFALAALDDVPAPRERLQQPVARLRRRLSR
jgi:hypothetical protein